MCRCAMCRWMRFCGRCRTCSIAACRQFKFVDRTFNLNLNIGRSILQFFHERYEPGMFLHFEMIPDRLPEALRIRSASSRRRAAV